MGGVPAQGEISFGQWDQGGNTRRHEKHSLVLSNKFKSILENIEHINSYSNIKKCVVILLNETK